MEEKLKTAAENGKILLLNPDNGHWVRMDEDRFQEFKSNEISADKFYKLLDEKYKMFDEPEDEQCSIRSVYFSVTGRCNLKCSFCTMNSGPEVSIEKDFSMEEIKSTLIPKLKAINPKKIIITGGEPLVRREIYSILELFKREFGKERIILQTNGILLTKEIIQNVKEYISYLEISIENIFESDELLSKMESIFQCAVENGIALSLSFVADTNSKKYINCAIDLCSKYNAIFILRIVSMVGRAAEESEGIGFLKETEILKIYYRAVRHLIENEYYTENLSNSFLLDLQPKRSCGGFGRILAIHPDGTTYMCGNFKSSVYSMGNIRDLSIEDIIKNLNDKLQDMEYKKHFRVDCKEMCKNCEVLYYCTGPCEAEAAENPGGKELCTDDKCFSKRALLKYRMFYYNSNNGIEDNLSELAVYLERLLERK